jgi:RNA polymerase sigma-70 factor (ECF subfamily)
LLEALRIPSPRQAQGMMLDYNAEMARSNSESEQFHTTHWSLVAAAAQGGSEPSSAALAALCAAYWSPLYGYLRRSGYALHDAQDLTQEFFARLLERDFFAAADRERGRFRSFLLASLKHFVANRHKAARAQKRGGGKAILSLDFPAAEAVHQSAARNDRTPEQEFEQQWATLLLERVLSGVEQTYADQGKTEQFAALREFLTAGDEHRPYRDVAAEMQTTEAAVKMAVHRLRRTYREALRAEIAHTLADPADVDEEMKDLFAALTQK